MARRDQRQMGEAVAFVEREALALGEACPAVAVTELVVAAENDVRLPG
jgi:hypothetical protein